MKAQKLGGLGQVTCYLKDAKQKLEINVSRATPTMKTVETFFKRFPCLTPFWLSAVARVP